MTGKKLLALCLTGILTLGLGTWTATADEAAEEDGIVGVYKAVDFTGEDAEGSSDEELEMMQALISKMKLELREDGTGTMDVFGQGTEIEWDDKNITIEGEAQPYTWEDGVLTMEDDEASIIFKKMTAEELENEEDSILKPGDYDPDTHAGYYKLASIEEDGEVTDASILSLVGMEVYLVLNEDNTGVMSMFEMPLELTWDDETITMEGETSEYMYDAGTIVMESEGSVMTFVYAGTPDEAPKPADAAAEDTAAEDTAAEDAAEDDAA